MAGWFVQSSFMVGMDHINWILGLASNEPGAVGCLYSKSFEMDGIEQGLPVDPAKRVAPKDPQAKAG